jgi:adenine-specific DNA-methyltransferase
MNLNENYLIKGDNFDVMKELVASNIYLDFMLWDPPYNTGNKNFMYNDSLNSSWPSFMEVRLELAKKLLKDTGVIAVHISYHELFRLGVLMDEIFGKRNRLSIITWESTYGPKNNNNNIYSATDYILIYAKNKKVTYRGIIPRTEALNNRYKNPDNDPRGPWISDNLTVGMNASMRPNQAYDLVNPKTNKVYKFNFNRVWAFIPSTMARMINEDRIIFPNDINKRPRLKRYLYELKEGINVGNYWKSEESIDIDDKESVGISPELSGNNCEAKKLIKAILGDKCVFDTPKPLKLTERLIEMFCPKDGIVLDAFAGSGTTAHAVLSLNAKDSNRKFICIEKEDFCDNITYERINRVISGKWENPQENSEPLSGFFNYITQI